MYGSISNMSSENITGPQPEEDKLPHENRIKYTSTLMVLFTDSLKLLPEFQTALNDTFFGDSQNKKRETISFEKDGLVYDVEYHNSPKLQGLTIEKHPSIDNNSKSWTYDRLSLVMGKSGTNTVEWGSVEYYRVPSFGEQPIINTNTSPALLKAEEFLADFNK